MKIYQKGALALNDDGDGNENVKKPIGLISKKTTSHVHHAFLYISFLFLYNYDVKMPNFAVKGDVNKQRRNFISLFEPWLWFLEIQLQEGSPTFHKVSG